MAGYHILVLQLYFGLQLVHGPCRSLRQLMAIRIRMMAIRNAAAGWPDSHQ